MSPAAKFDLFFDNKVVEYLVNMTKLMLIETKEGICLTLRCVFFWNFDAIKLQRTSPSKDVSGKL